MKKEKVLSLSEADELSMKIKTPITIANGIYLSERKKIPGVEFFKDDAQYFDPQSYKIHLGIYGPLSIFKIATAEDYVSAMYYLHGHENEHVRSTANVPYGNGIQRAMFSIVEFVAAKEGIRKNFRTPRDYEVFVNTELPKHGVYLSVKTIMSICSKLMNSVEDGRIERIRSLQFPGFEKQRRYFRSIIWSQDYDFKPYNQGLTAEDKLTLYMNSILSLSTTGLFLKGFVAEYGGTEIMDEVKAFMPYIAKGVLAKRTRFMADNVVEIAKLLAPYIYEVSKMSDAERAFNEFMQKLISQLISEMDPSQMAPTSEKEEQEDDGVPNSVFPQSDLVITLDDETYDKLMEKAKESGNQNGGIMVRREHPKEDSGEEGENDGNSNSNSSSKNANKDSDEKDSSMGGSSSKEGDDSNSDSNNAAKQSDSDKNGVSDASAINKSDEPEDYDKTYEHHDDGAVMQDEGRGSHKSGGGKDGTADMVHEQMKKAAEECRSDIAETFKNINTASEHHANTIPVKEDLYKPLTNADVKKICHGRNFEELKREYKLDQPLPALLAARAKAFRKKNERYFKSLSTPNVSNLDSGSIDPSLIYGLAFGETNVFRKIGNDKKFDGCVYILVDNSGSMCGEKRIKACKAAAVIEEGFKGIIPMKIVAFDTCGPVIHEVIKGWDESQKLNCCWNFASHGRTGCGNDDDIDIRIAQSELLKRSEEKKLLIVLSDGAPSDIEATKEAINETRKKGISVFGIYFEKGKIGADAKEFQHMYQKDYVCCELSDVDVELTRLMIKFSRS